ncbi:hypothetical protein [Cyanobium sp. Morenito 9A2]|uniref:hypothetical protein n=1 Tax=Cyanobium sp. Morenito 9A2 TaxID=2823718 RepID=UPI0020CE656C|nr:hypothetical protein [Cyanobium sp. Morenito 9A2]
MLALLGAASLRPAAAVMGGPKAHPYAQAVGTSVRAAEAVLAQTGTETCLRGKLTNAMLGLSASCEASGQRNPLCQLADQVSVITGPWSLGAMEDTARKVILLAAPVAVGGPGPVEVNR